MKTIIYKFATLEPIRLTEEDICITSLKEDEDMMPYTDWLEGDGKPFNQEK